eukprot:GCRY01003765.1.p1 GENE.GCRY01003765.1~~GCRY01003765.1.p1  ORF type:complete len:499 (-),score=98.71 GCRY01003765.1:9-1505(-)
MLAISPLLLNCRAFLATFLLLSCFLDLSFQTNLEVPLSLTPKGNVYGTFYVGHPMNTVDLLVDTASSYLVLFACTSSRVTNCFNTTEALSKHYIEYGSENAQQISYYVDLTSVTAGSCLLGTGVLGPESSGFTSKTPLFVCNSLFSANTYWGNVDGHIGITMHRTQDDQLSLLNANHNITLKSAGEKLSLANIFGPDGAASALLTFDINLSGNSTLYLGHNKHESSMVWGSLLQVNNDNIVTYYHRGIEFPLYQMEVCGVNLFSNYSAYWTALVDTGAHGLTLPADFFDMLFSWMPSECEDVEAYDSSGTFPSRICYLPKNIAPSTVPTISFRLNQNGQSFYLRTQSLLIDAVAPNETRKQYAIYRDRFIVMQAQVLRQYRISLGTLALSSLILSVDLNTGRVGMINKHISSSSEACPAAALCEGEERYYAPLNICLDPQCLLYYVQSVDDDKKCHVDLAFQIMFGFVLLLLLFGELLFTHLLHRLDNQVKSTVTPLN